MCQGDTSTDSMEVILAGLSPNAYALLEEPTASVALEVHPPLDTGHSNPFTAPSFSCSLVLDPPPPPTLFLLQPYGGVVSVSLRWYHRMNPRPLIHNAKP